MKKIAILSTQEAQKIAAGEVVERPANIVKELVENSLDAQATAIDIYIGGAGKDLIRVVDNGIGMSREDALLCFYPHATSKIIALHDLENIATFGFRGEALASIAAVSKVTLKTALDKKNNTELDDSSLGSTIIYEAGSLVDVLDAANPVGADFIITDLFYNVPVRKKFLKQDETEWNQIYVLLQGFCLSNNTVHFKIYRDNKLVLNAPAVNTLLDRISQLWDYTLAQSMLMLQVDNSDKKKPEWLNISGAISASHVWRYGKQHIFIFVNGRLVKDVDLNKALLKGYLNVLPPGKFPAAVLFINIDAHLVDVNVHPKKEEVRFTKPLTVQQVIKDSVQNTLASNVIQSVSIESRIDFDRQEEKEKDLSSSFVITSNASNYKKNLNLPLHEKKNIQKVSSYVDFLGTAVMQSVSGLPQKESLNFDDAKQADSFVTSGEKNEQNEVENSSIQLSLEKQSVSEQGVFIGQLFGTYLLIEQDNLLIIIDQHAAHERILYEKFIQRFENAAGSYLMFPVLMELDTDHIEGLLKQADLFAFHGIEFDAFSGGKLAIKTCPPSLLQADLEDFIRSCAQVISENSLIEDEDFRKKVHEHIHSQMACKSAIKAGDIVTAQQAVQLFTDLQKTEKPFICVHGRPTMWQLTQYDLEKNFRRR